MEKLVMFKSTSLSCGSNHMLLENSCFFDYKGAICLLILVRRHGLSEVHLACLLAMSPLLANSHSFQAPKMCFSREVLSLLQNLALIVWCDAWSSASQTIEPDILRSMKSNLYAVFCGIFWHYLHQSSDWLCDVWLQRLCTCMEKRHSCIWWVLQDPGSNM